MARCVLLIIHVALELLVVVLTGCGGGGVGVGCGVDVEFDAEHVGLSDRQYSVLSDKTSTAAGGVSGGMVLVDCPFCGGIGVVLWFGS
eukprot:6458117-Amphidinium_carterae.2